MRRVRKFLIWVMLVTTGIMPCLSLGAAKQGTIPLNQIDQLVIFGDSLSDTGNLYNATKTLHNTLYPQVPILPPSPPYFTQPQGANGRCSNSYIWIDWLNNSFMNLSKTSPTNWAVAGTKVKNTGADMEIPFDLSFFVSQYLKYNSIPPFSNNHLYILWGGSNDYLNPRDKNNLDDKTANNLSEDVTSAIQKQMQILISQANARYFLIVNVVDLGLTPYAKNPPPYLKLPPNFAAFATKVAQLHNQKLITKLDQLRANNPGIVIVTYDAYSDFTDIVNNPQKYGLDDSTNPCTNANIYTPPQNTAAVKALKENHYDVTNNAELRVIYSDPQPGEKNLDICNNPNMHLFWDNLHPTTIAHHIIAEKAYAALQNQLLINQRNK